MNLPFEQAVATHGETVLRVCRAVLGPGSDADGAWSETFLAALKAWPELDENSNVEAWLVRVAHRKAIDITRQLSRRARMVSPTPPEELPECENGVERGIDKQLRYLAAGCRLAAQTKASNCLSLPRRVELPGSGGADWF